METKLNGGDESLLHLCQRWNNVSSLDRWNNALALARKSLRNFQRPGAFMSIKKSSLRHREPIPNFFIPPLPILVRCNRKAAAGAVCAFGNLDTNTQLLSSCRWIFKELYMYNRMGDGLIFLKTSVPHSLMTTYRTNLLSARFISLDSAFKGRW